MRSIWIECSGLLVAPPVQARKNLSSGQDALLCLPNQLRPVGIVRTHASPNAGNTTTVKIDPYIGVDIIIAITHSQVTAGHALTFLDVDIAAYPESGAQIVSGADSGFKKPPACFLPGVRQNCR